MKPSPAFWSGRRVLLTGHTGFKGSWLSLWLARLGAQVRGIALKPVTDPALFDLARVGEVVESIECDVRDAAALRARVAEHRPEIVFHLAAQPLVLRSFRDPVETYQTNVMGLVHLFEAVRAVGEVRTVVNVTSDKCYENREQPWGYRETDAMGGFDPYSSSKGCAELVTAAYRRSFFAGAGVGLASARAGNVIGGGDWAEDRLVPDFMRALARGSSPIVRRPQAVRPWQHVLEPLRGYLQLAQRLAEDPGGFSSGWNFGPDARDAKPVSWIADRVCALWDPAPDRRARWERAEDPNASHEAGTLKLDCAMAEARLGWRPALNLEDALRMTVDWHRRALGGEDAQALCLEQISGYEEALCWKD